MKLLRHVGDKGRPFASQVLAPGGQLERNGTIFGLSKFHFQRLFKHATVVSPSRHQINLRINRARQLLRETKKSVIEVALDVGYTNPRHFAQLFRRETGLTPSEYRRQR